jgi:hypothetical protein
MPAPPVVSLSVPLARPEPCSLANPHKSLPSSDPLSLSLSSRNPLLLSGACQPLPLPRCAGAITLSQCSDTIAQRAHPRHPHALVPRQPAQSLAFKPR